MTSFYLHDPILTNEELLAIKSKIAKNTKILSKKSLKNEKTKTNLFLLRQFDPKPSTLTKKYHIFTNKRRLDAMLNLVKSIRLAP